jgi:hypothetical protein
VTVDVARGGLAAMQAARAAGADATTVALVAIENRL